MERAQTEQRLGDGHIQHDTASTCWPFCHLYEWNKVVFGKKDPEFVVQLELQLLCPLWALERDKNKCEKCKSYAKADDVVLKFGSTHFLPRL